jgi:hypothetical protein
VDWLPSPSNHGWGLGLLFTPWRFNAPLLLSGIVTMVAII